MSHYRDWRASFELALGQRNAFIVSTANTTAWYAVGPGSIPGEGSTGDYTRRSMLACRSKVSPSGTDPKLVPWGPTRKADEKLPGRGVP